MAKVEVTMPKMGESITEGTVIEWHKQPGDAVELDEPLLEIGTDKVDTEVPSPSAGVLQEILVEEGATVEVGTVIAILETEVDAASAGASAPAPPEAADEPAAEPEPEATPEAADAPEPEATPEAADTPETEATPAPPADEPAAQPKADAPPAGGGGTVEVVMPKMGESITEGTVLVWHKQPGDAVELDEPLLEIGTDKVDTEVPSPSAGVLQEILVEEGATVDVGTVIAILGTEAGAAAIPSAPAGTPKAEATAPPAKPAPAAASAPSGDGAAAQPAPVAAGDSGPIERQGSDGRFYSPLVRAIAEKEGLSMAELESIPGSGREGRVTKQDVMGYLDRRARPEVTSPAAPPPAQPPKAPSRPAPSTATTTSDGSRVEVIEMDRMRQIIADHMVRSKSTSAHVTSFAEADVTNLVRLREKHKHAFLEREGVKLTYTPFFVEAAVEALRDHPLLNASVEEKRIVVKHDFHIGIAVAIGKSGLLAPVMRNAGHMNVTGLARAAADLAVRARSKQLNPDELQGGTFTVTNIGSLGSIMGTPIINQPQVAILATGAIKKRPVVIEDPNLGDIIAVRQIMYVSLSYDHRIIDGSMSASFLQKYVAVLEGYDPDSDL